MTKVIGFSGSPRAGGNTDILLRRFLRGAEAASIQTENIFLRDYSIQPCVGCERCRKSRTCLKFSDGMQLLYPKIAKDKELLESAFQKGFELARKLED